MEKITTKSSPQDVMRYVSSMNRAEKRKLAKKMKMSYQHLKNTFTAAIDNISIDFIPNGTKIKLKTKQILEKEKELSEDYIKFVKEHNGKILTAYHDIERTGYSPNEELILVREDPEKRWIFHNSDVELVFDETEKQQMIKDIQESNDNNVNSDIN